MGVCVQKWDGAREVCNVHLSAGSSMSVPMLMPVFVVDLETNHSIELTVQRDSKEGFGGCEGVKYEKPWNICSHSALPSKPVVSQLELCPPM